MTRAIVAVRDFLILSIPSFLQFCILLWVVAIGPFCWIMRDGLGPDSVESHGAHAVVRFLGTFYWGPVLLVLLALVTPSFWFARRFISIDAEESI